MKTARSRSINCDRLLTNGSETFRVHAHFKLARHDQSRGRSLPGGARGRRTDAGRCGAKRGASADRCAGIGMRFSRFLRTQNVWADRYRRALRSRGNSRRDAAVAGRRRNDRQCRLSKKAPSKKRRTDSKRARRISRARSDSPRRSITSSEIGRSAIFEHDSELSAYAVERLAELPGMRCSDRRKSAARSLVLSWRACIRTI